MVSMSYLFKVVFKRGIICCRLKQLNSLQNDKISDLSKLKAIADDKINEIIKFKFDM